MQQSETTVYCRRCEAIHPARVQREGRYVAGVVECPHNPPPVQLSDDADLFLHLRSLDAEAQWSSEGTSDRVSRGQIYITEACDWSCPVCYASSGPRAGDAHMPVAEIARRAAAARERGVRQLLFLGGEPTQHPQLCHAIQSVRRLGLSVSLVTNGEAIGRDPVFARNLKRAGLRHMNLQFDTLEPSTLRRLRGRADIALKKTAIAHAVAAGLPYSLTATMTTANLTEVGAMVKWAGALPVMPSLFLFQSMVPSGRFPESLQGASREAVINSLFGSGAVESVTRSQLHPVPRVPPQAVSIHPDCGTLLFLLRHGSQLVPADQVFDITGFRRTVIGDGAMHRTWLKWLVELVRHTRPGSRRELITTLLSLRPGHPNRRLMMVGFTSYCDPAFLDARRLSRCGNHELLASGAAPVCSHFGRPHSPTPSFPRT